MHEILIKTIWLIWIPVVSLLFRLIEPRRAVLIAIIGGVLFLPSEHLKLGLPWFAFQIDRWITTGIGLILGVLLFDRPALARFRPNWLDLPMVIYALIPLVGLVSGPQRSTADVIEIMSMRGIGWLVPYAMGRLYFSRSDGPARVGIALTIGGLIYIPFCLYEEFAGPTRYLTVLVYGIPYKVGMEERLGGYRPEVFLGNGLALCSWMALTTVVSTWLWLGKIWRIRGLPGWIPPLALVATTLSCRGVYGYIVLAIGVATAFLTRFLRTRLILGLLLLVPCAYMGLRGSGLWDGDLLVKGAGLMQRASTVEVRLLAEDGIIHRVLKSCPIFGFGNIVYHSDVALQPDALWLQSLWMGGLVGLTVHMVFIFALPAILGLAKPPGRPDRREAASPTWALACWCVLQSIEGMNNSNNFSATALIGGTLVGYFLARPAEIRSRDWSFETARPLVPWPLLITIVCLLAIEVLGQFLRPSVEPFPPPADVSAPAKTPN